MITNAVEDPHQRVGAAGQAVAVQDEVYVARQPLLDREGMLCGFELKAHIPVVPDPDPANFTDSEADVAALKQAVKDAQAARVAVAKRAIQASAHPDAGGALAGHMAYVDASCEMLFDETLRLLPPARFMLELAPDLVADDMLVSRVLALHGKRYRFVLDNVTQPNETFAKLLPYAEAVKIDFRRTQPALLPKLAKVLKAAGKILIAKGLDTQADFQTAHDLGFDRFQGYFFARPQAQGMRRASAPRHALLNLLQLLASDPTVAQLEAELKLNPVLVMHLMRLANSSSLGLGHKVTSLREAINATGTNRIARWTQLLLYADGRKVSLEDDPLLQLAATRARFMELAIERLPEAGRDEADAAFLTGVFSFVDAVFGEPLDNTLDMLMLTRPIRAAILRREGALGMLLSAIDALERGAWSDLEAASAQLGPLTPGDLASLGLVAAAWAGVADSSAEAAGLERIED
ncbi:EAL and HDOD domain-containing protein [Paraburkholderia saeva]|uniref:EAL and HDOD domain-containing protein n=1 Tax=Paraburkholderia saeva TaxID=2777537 RepID=UPI001D21A98C|nr:Cyclic di-GMP phosphodiesterase CdgJ [Paraburkholderia saeva]